MSHEKLFDHLNERGELAEKKQLLRGHLVDLLEYQAQYPEQSEQIAYGIAGLMATTFAEALPDDDPYMEILYMAGELELPPQHRSQEATWEGLKQLVQQLQ